MHCLVDKANNLIFSQFTAVVFYEVYRAFTCLPSHPNARNWRKSLLRRSAGDSMETEGSG